MGRKAGIKTATISFRVPADDKAKAQKKYGKKLNLKAVKFIKRLAK